MNTFVAVVERVAGYFIGCLAVITFTEAILRYVFNTHIPDGFVLGQMMQGIAICWGIATATYADRHITVDVLYAFCGPAVQRAFDVIGFTINLLFLALFGYASSVKVLDILKAGETSDELLIPLWTGYIFAAAGIVIAVLMAAIRWWQIVFQHGRALQQDH